MITLNLDKYSFNSAFSLKGMSHNSVILLDNVTKQEVYCHRRVLNTILKSEESLPCALINRDYMGKTTTWLATMFTL